MFTSQKYIQYKRSKKHTVMKVVINPWVPFKKFIQTVLKRVSKALASSKSFEKCQKLESLSKVQETVKASKISKSSKDCQNLKRLSKVSKISKT